MHRILNGVLRFQKEVYPRERALFETLASGQNPEALMLACSDSRISTEMLTQTRPGELFVCRNAGNIAPPHPDGAGGVAATVEYAIEALGVRHVVVCGHSDCGAMKAVLNPGSVSRLPSVAAWLRYSEMARAVAERSPAGLTLSALIEENVLTQLEHLRTYPSVASRLRTGELFLHGWVYDIKTGSIRAYDPATRSFQPVREMETETMYA